MNRSAGSVLVALVIVAALVVVLRPNSRGSTLVSGISAGLARLVSTVTGKGSETAGSADGNT